MGYLGKYTANNDYTEEEVRRISIAAAMLVSAAAIEIGGGARVKQGRARGGIQP